MMGNMKPPSGGSQGELGERLLSSPSYTGLNESGDEWWSVPTAAHVSGLSCWVIRKLCRGGVFRTRKPGKFWQIDSSGFVSRLLRAIDDEAWKCCSGRWPGAGAGA